MLRLPQWKVVVAALSGLALVGISPGVHAERDLVFSAQSYRWSGRYVHSPYDARPEQTLTERGPSHLYRVNPDGSRRTPLTFGRANDYRPRWSPDGGRILFARSLPGSKAAICVMGATGGRIRRLLTVEEAVLWDGEYAWSPDGRWIAVYAPDNSRRQRSRIYALHVRTGRRRTFPGGYQFAWSPDSRRLFLCFGTPLHPLPRCQIWSRAGGRMAKVAMPLWNPLWLDRNTIAGLLPASEEQEPQFLRFLDGRGREKRRLPLRFPQEDRLFVDGGRWIGIPGSRTKIVFERRWGMSDGNHYRCYLLDLQTGLTRPLRDGRCLGVSPDGRVVAVADSEWLGPYKRGGRRCGPLEVVSLPTGAGRAITPRLVRIAGGDWRRSRR